MAKKTVVFLCGRKLRRSQMAEGFSVTKPGIALRFIWRVRTRPRFDRKPLLS
jgi:protein-tyrosine-phosphatase